MTLPLNLKPHWLINLLTRHQHNLHLNKQGLTDSRHSPAQDFPWQEMPCQLQIDSGFFFAALLWQHKDKVYRFSWLPQKKAEQIVKQANAAWCQHHGKKLLDTANHCYRLLHPGNKKRYLRQQTWFKLKSCAQTALKNWPEILPAAGLSQEQQQAFIRLQHLAKWSEKDLQQYRQDYIQSQQQDFAGFFQQIESNPLTSRQQIACITDEHNNLVLAGAGTGKTSVMVGRTGYLLHSQQADAGEILLLAFGNKAAKEMDERLKQRLGRDDIKASTFHALGQAIISQVEGKSPQLSPLAQDETAKTLWLGQQLEQLLAAPDQDNNYPDLVINYLELFRFPKATAFDFSTLAQHIAYLKNHRLTSLAGERVHSYAELLIADYLHKTGISYHYRQGYCPPCKPENTGKKAVKTADARPYKPMFYLPEYDITIEFRHIKTHGETPVFIDRQAYQRDILWQRQYHKNNNSCLIELDQALLTSGKLTRELALQLKKYAVPLTVPDNQSLLSIFRDNGALTELAKLLSQILTLYKAGGFEQNSLKQQLKAYYASKPEGLANDGTYQLDLTLQLLTPLYRAYQAMLAEQQQIDFDDMITKATTYIESGQFTPPWSYIMVDEFQDISRPRAKLIKALRDAHSHASLFCVGDDWQAIYRFAGSDVSLTRNFSAYFGHTCITTLDKTFRFNNSICDIASRFVSQNPAQLTKKLTTFNRVTTPAVTISQAASTALAEILTDINAREDKSVRKKPCTILLLARYHHLLPNKSALRQLAQQFPALSIKALSIHASKGMEADIVLLLGLDQGKHGFPAQKSESMLIDALLPLEGDQSQSPAYAEERRLFYVALTRAKHHVYLLADSHNPSEFIRELITDQYPVNQKSLPIDVLTAKNITQEHSCPLCKSGVLTARSGQYGNFYSCSNYPYCQHSEQAIKPSVQTA